MLVTCPRAPTKIYSKCLDWFVQSNSWVNRCTRVSSSRKLLPFIHRPVRRTCSPIEKCRCDPKSCFLRYWFVIILYILNNNRINKWRLQTSADLYSEIRVGKMIALQLIALCCIGLKLCEAIFVSIIQSALEWWRGGKEGCVNLSLILTLRR